ncbi:SDR family NAD(P)-dependent oxidoreductase [Ketobacter alkanivorans]|uniref:Short-chain dehydrogenase n=1 Tax=Ketobacter alkanivorans TaxID=1917421 RepID=A0A2K9LJI8_9GAMM|nr:SDR family NAD(P)-dependent oxidoreductase [Ketobacter alkanivorans]AUM12331.1 short-chain dehydrogenase [Ketobacter alkanivorans]MCP5018623.1 SDR family NAD(P)-dependent oxidoreductase [Ketobacter sp.]
MNLSPRVILVTGASRGAGKGIAQAFGRLGDIVYITGRSQKEGDAPLPGTVFATANAITRMGGVGVPVVCDHSDDAQVKQLFQQIMEERGQLDILVNNATALHDDLVMPGPFWEKSLDLVDILNVGLRSSYVASYYAARIMAQQKSGLIVNTSSPGAACYMHGPAYGAQKAGSDKMIWDMAQDLKPFNVGCASIWMGVLKTERLDAVMAADPEKYAAFFQMAESPEFTGRVIDALYRDENLLDKTGRAFIGAEIGMELGVCDLDGSQPHSHREALGGPLPYNPAVVQ